MKVVYLNTFGNYGGAAIAALRSLQAARGQGVDARMLAGFRLPNDNSVQEIMPGLMPLKKAIMAAEVLSYLIHAADKNKKFIFSPGTTGLPVASHPTVRQADVVHLHWTHQGLLSLSGMEKIFSMGKPVVFTLHDQWMMTGGCYYPMGCDGYFNECHDCPLLKKGSMIAHKTYSKKRQLFSSARPHIIAISQWMKKEIEQSPLLSNTIVHHIPNAIDTAVFRPMDKGLIVQELGFNQNKKRIGFVAVNVNDPRKGAKYLMEALKSLDATLDPDKFEILLIGRSEAQENFKTRLNIITTGFVSPVDIPKYYNAMDVFVLPSIIDNLPNSVMEALSCGIPTVGFRIGGVPDMVIHKQTGYLARPKDARDLARGIEWVLTEADYEQLSLNAREFVVKNFSYETIGKKLLNLYQNILHK